MSLLLKLLERTIRSAVEQHLFDVNNSGGQSSEDSESGTPPASSATSARQRRRQSKEQDEVRRGRDNFDHRPGYCNQYGTCTSYHIQVSQGTYDHMEMPGDFQVATLFQPAQCIATREITQIPAPF
ncbi:Protein fam13a, partial [Saguinus oedipus]